MGYFSRVFKTQHRIGCMTGVALMLPLLVLMYFVMPFVLADHYASGDKPNPMFQIAVESGPAGGTVQVTLVPLARLKQWESSRSGEQPDAYRLHLSQPAATVPDPGKSELTSTVDVLENRRDNQLVEVSHITETDTTVSRYRVSDTGITPLYFRRVSRSTFFVALAASVVLSLACGWLVMLVAAFCHRDPAPTPATGDDPEA